MTVLDLSAYKPVPATLGDANQIANGMQAIQNCINALDNNNFGAGKIFDPLKLMQDGAVAGQALVWSAAANGGTGGWVPGSGGALVLIDDLTVAGSALASYDTNTRLGGNIPATYKHLRLIFQAQGTTAGTKNVLGTINGDTGTNYNWQRVQGNGAASMTSAEVLSGTAIRWGDIAGSGGGFAGMSVTDFPNYLGTTFYKQSISNFAYWNSAGTNAMVMSIVGGFWLNTVAITRLTAAPDTGSFAIGSRFSLYGVN